MPHAQILQLHAGGVNATEGRGGEDTRAARRVDVARLDV